MRASASGGVAIPAARPFRTTVNLHSSFEQVIASKHPVNSVGNGLVCVFAVLNLKPIDEKFLYDVGRAGFRMESTLTA